MKRAYLLSVEAADPAEEAARRNHYEGEAVTESFWRKAAASLPPHARRRYGHLFVAAEQYEPVVEFIVDSCARASHALGRLFRARPARDETRRPRHFREVRRA